ncbi:MAG: SpoIIE family protein phosphatase, partial [Akkermansiaceae bacterium]|nr:SpoIIE family protein phosphatase [Akkermansiaceae bacterium]
FDLVVTDWLMSGMDGLELLGKIRDRGKHADYVYAIILTSRTETRDMVTGIEAGADDFVCKPFDKDELRVRIKAAERIVELEHALARQNRQLAAANKVLSAANHRMKESLQAAAEIQRSFLPEHPPECEAAKFAWVYEPCEELAGDTLNIVPLDDSHVGIYIIDVSGHGVPAALLSVHLSRILTRLHGTDSLLRRLVSDDGDSGYEVRGPAEVTSALNQRFMYDEETQQYFTALYGILDLETRKFRYTSAGHPGPLVVSGGSGRLHKARPPAVGFLPASEFSEQTLQCAPGDRLYFYTDGIFEVTNRNGEEFGEEGVCRILEAACHDSLAESLRTLREAARAWQDDKPFQDDLSLIAVELS